MVSALAICGIMIATVIGAIASLFLKYSSGKFSISINGMIKNRYFMLGVLCYGISTVFYLAVLKMSNLSITYPLVSMQYIWISLLSIRYLNEKMNALKWAGIALIILGAGLISFG